MTDQLYRIPPLEWVAYNRSLHRARTPWGDYEIARYDHRYGAGGDVCKIRWCIAIGPDEHSKLISSHDSIPAAKAAAEAHYREQMERGLVRVER